MSEKNKNSLYFLKINIKNYEELLDLLLINSLE